MKKPLSTMTAQEFIEIKGALRLNRNQLAQLLNKAGATITGYENGNPIPVEVVNKLQALLKQERERIQRAEGVALTTIGSMIVYQNQTKPRELHQTVGRLYRRQRVPDLRTYPAYRMSVKRFAIFVEALARWTKRVREMALEYGDAVRQRDYQLELADLKQMAATVPRHAPYDVCIQRNEWDVVSRALRYMHATLKDSHDPVDREKAAAADALRVHWARYRGSGYPPNRT